MQIKWEYSKKHSLVVLSLSCVVCDGSCFESVEQMLMCAIKINDMISVVYYAFDAVL